jgi:hypothetical protein
LVIGELGRGEAPQGAYGFARNLLNALSRGNKDAPVVADSLSVLDESVFEEISSLKPRTYRIGGGRTEPDGSVSFLVRFLGTEESIAGELFVRQAEQSGPGTPAEREAAWFLDDLILEERRALVDIKDSYRYDFSPYERFY